MAEWLILLLLVPAIVVPVVLLLGFAGCDNVFGLDRVTEKIAIDKAETHNATTIKLTWSSPKPAAKFQFERLKMGEMTPESFEAVSSPFFDQGLDSPDDTKRLEPATTYFYRVAPILGDGTLGEWSSDKPDEPGTTRSLAPAFGWSDPEQQQSRNLDVGMGQCLVQRIEPSRLSAPPNTSLVRLHLRASSMASAAIESIYISRAADPGPGVDAYDSDGVPTLVQLGTTLVPTNNAVELEVYFELDPSSALLIAMDFRPVSPSAIRVVDLPPDQAVAYVKDNASEAGVADRSGFTGTPGVYFIERIEAG